MNFAESLKGKKILWSISSGDSFFHLINDDLTNIDCIIISDLRFNFLQKNDIRIAEFNQNDIIRPFLENETIEFIHENPFKLKKLNSLSASNAISNYRKLISLSNEHEIETLQDLTVLFESEMHELLKIDYNLIKELNSFIDFGIHFKFESKEVYLLSCPDILLQNFFVENAIELRGITTTIDQGEHSANMRSLLEDHDINVNLT